MKTFSKIAVTIIVIFSFLLSGLFVGAALQAGIDGRSPMSKLVEMAMQAFYTPFRTDTEEQALADVETNRKINENYSVPNMYRKLFGIEVKKQEGFEVCYYGAEDADLTVFYLHGGIFMYQPTVVHYAYGQELAKKLSARVIMPVYPKSPEYQYEFIMNYLRDFYLTFCDNSEVVFMGDSAGASLIISLSQKLYDEGLPLPAKLYSFSPCMDFSFSNPEIDSLIPLDPMLEKSSLLIKLNFYVGDGDITNPYLSPIFADFSVLPPLIVFMGGHEILAADGRKYEKMMADSGLSDKMRYIEFPYQNHVFAIYPMVEGWEVLNIIKNNLEFGS